MTLPILRVATKHSVYVIDQNTGEFKRTRVHEDANDLTRAVPDDGWAPYVDAFGLEVGGRIRLYLPNGYSITSTEIESVEEIHSSVRA